MELKWIEVPRDEQETIMKVDYCEKTIMVYTNRKSVGERLLKKLGEPTKIDKTNDLISGITYVKSLFDKDTNKFFSKLLIVGSYRIL